MNGVPSMSPEAYIARVTSPISSTDRPRPGPCPCACNSGGFCGGCGHAGCGGRR